MSSKLKNLNSLIIYLIVMGLEIHDILDLEKGIKKIGINTPVFIFLFLLLSEYKIYYLILFIFSLIVCISAMVSKDRIKYDIGGDVGNKLIDGIRQWEVKATILKIIPVYLSLFNLIMATSFSLAYLMNAFKGTIIDYTLIILTILSGGYLGYIIFFFAYNWDKISLFIKRVREQK